MSQTTPPTYREILLHLAEVSAMHYKGLPEGVIRHYGTAKLYETFLSAVFMNGPIMQQVRWLTLINGKIGVRFGDQGIYVPNNGNGVGQLLANCLKFDPILRAFVDESYAQGIIESDCVIGNDAILIITIKQPPRWLWVDNNPWARLVEAGREMGRLAQTPEVNSAEAENAMQRRVLTEMLDRYEPKE
jgi:hypothetical protein